MNAQKAIIALAFMLLATQGDLMSIAVGICIAHVVDATRSGTTSGHYVATVLANVWA